MRTTLIPVTVDTFETQRWRKGSKSDDSYEEDSLEAAKTVTVTRMATPRGPIPVTVDTFEALGGRGGIHGQVGGGNAERRCI